MLTDEQIAGLRTDTEEAVDSIAVFVTSQNVWHLWTMQFGVIIFMTLLAFMISRTLGLFSIRSRY